MVKKLPGNDLLNYQMEGNCWNTNLTGISSSESLRKLELIGIKYYNVVPEVNVDNFLENRVARANKKTSPLPKLFVSIHSNAAPAPHNKWASPNIHGVETWFYHGNNRGKKLAAIFSKTHC